MREGRDWERMFKQRDAYERWLDERLMLLEAPSILLGDEFNTVHFDWDAAREAGELDDRFKVALVEANASGYAACSVAIKIFYQQLHEYDERWVVERCFLPASDDNRRMMRADGMPLVSAEGHMPLCCFDVICCSQQMLGDEVNIVDMLNFLGVGATWQQRSESDPLVIRGGSSSFNPSLIKDVCDLYFIGEGEDILPALLAQVEEGMRAGRSHEDILLKAVQTWDCLWAPCFYEERFSATGELLGMFPLRDDVPATIRSYHVRDLDNCFIMTKPIGDFHYPSYISGGIEITRGCDGQCSFCVSGFTYLPFRARSVDAVLRVMKEHLRHSGLSSITLNSFCGSSYPHINELMRRVYDELPRRVRMMSQRIDSVHENPHLCALLTRSGSKRIVFGVEGISQRLRQAVSKNYTEQQILDTVRMLAREGYERVKFMFIGGLPGECRADWEELVDLSAKIRSILDEAQCEGFRVPVMVYTWTQLEILPAAPFQWMKPPLETSAIPEDIEQRLCELGVIIGEKGERANRVEYLVTQLFLRGDSRLQPLIVDMANAGIGHHVAYPAAAEEFIGAWLAVHDVPGWDYWFRECDRDTVFPWDFINFGASKDHLWRRYAESRKEMPSDFPRCLSRCQGCGACSPEQHANMATYREEKLRDNALPLSDLLPARQSDGRDGQTGAQVPAQYAAIEFAFDDRHRVVNHMYWANELGRALNYAGIGYDGHGPSVFKPFYGREDWVRGMNVATIGLDERHDDERFIAALNEHLVNMRATRVRWFDHLPRLYSMTYRFPLPDGVDLCALAERVSAVMDAKHRDEGPLVQPVLQPEGPAGHDGNGKPATPDDLWERVYDISLEGRDVHMCMDARLSPYKAYQELFHLTWEEASRYPVERTSVEFFDQPSA